MRTIKIAFARAIRGNPIDWLIGIFSCGWASHVEAVFEDGTAYSARPFEGTSFHSIDLTSKRWVVIDVKMSNQDYKQFYLFCKGEEGCGYDWAGVLSFIVPFLRDSRTRWFCTEVILGAMKKTGRMLRVAWRRTTPTQMYRAFLKSGYASHAQKQKDQ